MEQTRVPAVSIRMFRGGATRVSSYNEKNINAVVGELKLSRANDFSKIQGRFRTRPSLSRANVDAVIQARLLAKRSDVVAELQALLRAKGDPLKNQLTFTNCGKALKAERIVNLTQHTF
jgi:hypothetical protein